jgi:excisionase family DNA binding protein
MSESHDESMKALTTGTIARYCDVTYRTVEKWIANGKLKAYRTPGHHCRVKMDDFLSFLQEYKMPIPSFFRQENPKSRVLIVDDDPTTVNFIKKTLTLQDDRYLLEEAYDGFSAGQIFAEFHPNLVILDIYLPGLKGFEVCSLMRKKTKNIGLKILAISGISRQEIVKKVIQAGADDFLAKPFTPGILKTKLLQLLNSTIKRGGK